MKKIAVVFVAALVAFLASAEPVKALLVVQNHSPEKVDLAYAAGALQTALSDSGDFEVINPSDVVGEEQNVGPWGEKMPASSAVRLAETCDANMLITAAITTLSKESMGYPAKGNFWTVTWTIAAKRVPSGSVICSVTVPCKGDNTAPQKFEQSVAKLRNDVIMKCIGIAGESFLAKVSGRNLAPEKIEKVHVAFLSNVPGADVKIDGVTYGIAGPDVSAPLRVEVAKGGTHNIEISYPFMQPYKTTAKFTADSTFAVNLKETLAGRNLRMGDTEFAVMMDRVVKGGATDDEVKLIKAKGYASFLEASSVKVEGMPEKLTLVNGKPDMFGLGIFQVEKE